MTTNEEYKEYHGEPVRVIVDARAYGFNENEYSSQSSNSLSIEAILREETETQLKLVEISVDSRGIGCEGVSPNASISKSYVIGVFAPFVKEKGEQ